MNLSIILGIVIRLVIYSQPELVIPLDELLEFPPLDQFFNLFFQITTLVGVVAVIFVKTTILLQVVLPRGHA